MYGFYALRSGKRIKDTDDLTVFFMLLGSTSVKAGRKMLVKLTLGHTFEITFTQQVVIIAFCLPVFVIVQ